MEIYRNFQKIQNSTQQLIDISSASYQYGIGCFTTTRTLKQKIFQLQDHLKRLQSNLKQIQSYGFLKKIEFDPVKIEHFLTQKTITFSQDIRIKIMLTADGVLIYLSRLEIDHTKIEAGVSCKTLKLKRNFPTIKSTSYQDSMFAFQMAGIGKHLECDEIIFEDDFGNYLEAHFSNIMWIKQSQLFRSPRGAILEGVTQKLIQKIYPKVGLGYFNKTDLESGNVQAAFLTKSTTFIEPIKNINNIKLNPKHPIIRELKGKITTCI